MQSFFRNFFNNDSNRSEPGEVVYVNKPSQDTEELKLKATIEGLVQGVGFRYSTYYLAKELNINGVVKNKYDGTVYVEAVGESEAMKQFIRELSKGPSPSAKVDKVTVEYDDSISDYTSFSQDR